MADTAIRTVRMDDPLWERFGAATDDRSAVIRQFVHWYVGDEGWELPSRPEQPVPVRED